MGYEGKAGKAYARGALRSCAVLAVGLPLGIALVGTVLWVAGGREANSDSYRPLLALMVPMAFTTAVLALAWLFVALRSRKLDRAFRWLEVEGHQVGGVLRGWHGTFEGRAFDAWVRQGPTVEIYLGCRPATRGGIARSGRVVQSLTRRLARREPLAPTPPQVAGCAVYADDPDWMRRLLAQPGVAEPLSRLLAETDRVSPLLSFNPDAVHYTRRFGPLSEVEAESIRGWLADLERIAEAVDAQGPSADGAAPSDLEEWGRRRRGRRFMPWFFGCMGLVLVLFWVFLIALFYFTHYR